MNVVVDDVVRSRVAEAELLLAGLAVPGSTAHAALLALERPRRGDAPVATVVLDAVEAVRDQAELTLRAGHHAAAARGVLTGAVGPHWLVATAHDWQRYLRWLVVVHDGLAADVAALPGVPRWAAVRVWEQAADACAEARRAWGALVPDAGRGVPEDQHRDRDQPGTVVVDGRVHVDVEDPAASLRVRAGALVAAAVAAGDAGDEVGRLVSEAVSTEPASRADGLDVASIDRASTRGDVHRVRSSRHRRFAARSPSGPAGGGTPVTQAPEPGTVLLS